MQKDFKLTPQQGGAKPKVNITPEMMKSFKTLRCDCGNELFQPGLVIKKISALISPTGQEELYPMEVLVCTKCGKVPNELNNLGMMPESIMAEKVKGSTPEPPAAGPFKVENTGNGLRVVKE